MIPRFDFVGHDEKYVNERGASREEVGQTLAAGRESPTYGNRFSAVKVFTEGYEYRGRTYRHKEIKVVYAYEEWGLAVITVIVRFGFWSDSE